MAKDQVCGMNVNEKTAKYKSEHMGKTYYFCSQACKTAFDENPMEYVGSGGHSEHSEHSGHHSCGC